MLVWEKKCVVVGDCRETSTSQIQQQGVSPSEQAQGEGW